MERNTFVVRRTDNDLQHFKYIKKKKVNGKWRYYYDIGPGYGIVDGQKMSSVKGYSKFQDLMGQDEKDRYDRAVNRVARAERNYIEKRNISKHDNNISYQTYVNAGISYTKARKAYMKTPLGKLKSIKNTIDNGRNKLADLLYKASIELRTH